MTNPAFRVHRPDDVPKPPPRVPVHVQFAKEELQVRLAVRRLGTLSTRRWHRRRPAILDKYLSDHPLAPALCRGLLVAMREHVQRSADRTEAAEFRHHVLATLDALLDAEIDARHGAAPVPSLAEASVLEQRTDNPVDQLQAELALGVTPGLVARIRGAVPAAIEGLRGLLTAAERHERGWV